MVIVLETKSILCINLIETNDSVLHCKNSAQNWCVCSFTPTSTHKLTTCTETYTIRNFVLQSQLLVSSLLTVTWLYYGTQIHISTVVMLSALERHFTNLLTSFKAVNER